MKCVKCPKTALIALRHLGGSLCPACFAEVIEKRVRKALRENDKLMPKEKVLVIDDGTIKAKVCIYLLKAIFKGQPFKFEFKKAKLALAKSISRGYDRTVIPWNADDEIEHHLKAMFSGKKPEAVPFVKLLLNVSDEELGYFAEINGIKGRKSAKSSLGRMLDDLEKKYPGSKFGLLKSFSS